MGWVGPAKWVEPMKLSWAGLGPTDLFCFSFFGAVLDQNWPGPKQRLIICRTWTIVHVLHATEMVAENGGWLRYGSLEAGVLAVIRRLSWWFCRRHCEEWWPESITGERRRILKRWERKKRRLFQAWWRPNGGLGDGWWSWWWRSWRISGWRLTRQRWERKKRESQKADEEEEK